MALGVESIDFHIFASCLQLSFEFVPLEWFLSLETVRIEPLPSSFPSPPHCRVMLGLRWSLVLLTANCALRMLFGGGGF